MSTAIFTAAARGAFARARLQHIELALFDRKFQVLHFAIMLFHVPRNALKFRIHFGHAVFHFCKFHWRPNARHHIFTLRVLK